MSISVPLRVPACRRRNSRRGPCARRLRRAGPSAVPSAACFHGSVAEADALGLRAACATDREVRRVGTIASVGIPLAGDRKRLARAIGRGLAGILPGAIADAHAEPMQEHFSAVHRADPDRTPSIRIVVLASSAKLGTDEVGAAQDVPVSGRQDKCRAIDGERGSRFTGACRGQAQDQPQPAHRDRKRARASACQRQAHAHIGERERGPVCDSELCPHPLRTRQ